MLWLYIIIFAVSCGVVVKSASLTIKALAKIAKFLNWSEFFVSFLLMALATSLPELFVGITSALRFTPQLAFGNVIGANIINLTLAAAIAVLAGGKLLTDNLTIQRTSIYAGLIAFLPLILMFDGNVSRFDGIILLVVLGFYLRWALQRKNRFVKKFSNIEEKVNGYKIPFLKDISAFFIGVSLLVLSSNGIVWASSKMALSFGLPTVVIGILLVALGTTLPEIIFSIKAVRLGHKSMVLGNLMGSIIFNSSLILGVTVLISPLRISSFGPYLVGIIFTVLAVLFFRLFVKSGRSLSKKEAWLLLLIYFTFIVSQFMLS